MWINVKRGSVYVPGSQSPEENLTGSDAEHLVQSPGARIAMPVRGPMSVGMDFSVFLRNNYFSREDFVDTTQRVPQARFYLAWATGE